MPSAARVSLSRLRRWCGFSSRTRSIAQIWHVSATRDQTYLPVRLFRSAVGRGWWIAAASALFAILLFYDDVNFTPWRADAALFVMLIVFSARHHSATSAINVFYRDVSPVVHIAAAVALSHPVAYPFRGPAEYRAWFMLIPRRSVEACVRCGSAALRGAVCWSARDSAISSEPGVHEHR